MNQKSESKSEFPKIKNSKNWFKNFRNLLVCLTASSLLTSSFANQKLVLDSSSNLIRVEFGEKEFQKTLIQRLESLNAGNPEKLALVKISEYAGQFVELSLSQKIEIEEDLSEKNTKQKEKIGEKIEENKNKTLVKLGILENNGKNKTEEKLENVGNFSLQNLEFKELNGDKKHTIGFVASPKLADNSLEIISAESEKSTQINKTIIQNVDGEKAKSDYPNYKKTLIEFLTNSDQEKPENLFLSAFGIKMIDGKPDPELILEFTKRGYTVIYTAMANGERETGKNQSENWQNSLFSFGNLTATKKSIDNSQIILRVPREGLSVPNKNLTNETIAKMVKENSTLIYVNHLIQRIEIDKNGQKISQLIGTNYFNYFSSPKMRKANFEQTADYLENFLLKESDTQILIGGDFNTMGNIDGRDLGGQSEFESIINQAKNFVPNLGSSWGEIDKFKLILDNLNFKFWEKRQKNKENRMKNVEKLEYRSSNLFFRGFGVKKIILEILNLTLDGTITNLPIADFDKDWKPNSYIIQYNYFDNYAHPQTIIRKISREEFEQIKKQKIQEKADKLATSVAIMQIMSF